MMLYPDTTCVIPILCSKATSRLHAFADKALVSVLCDFWRSQSQFDAQEIRSQEKEPPTRDSFCAHVIERSHSAVAA